MRLHEYQAKQIFENEGIPIPDGEIAQSPEEAEKIAEKLDERVAVKAQVHVGGRGKAGGVKIASSPPEARTMSEKVLGMNLKGRFVEKVLVEEAAEICQEFYIGVTLDREQGQPVAIVSSEGGENIEKIAEERPDAIAKKHINYAYGLQDFEAREILYKANIPKNMVREVSSTLKLLYSVWKKTDAEDAEVNPLVMTEQNNLLGVDAVLNIDDSALYRQKNLADLREETFEDELEAEASEKEFDYVRLDGNIGVIGNGAGLVMTTLDLIDHYGGSPSNFLDVGGGAKAEILSEALEFLLRDDQVDVVLLNIFGGITRCDEVARGINQALEGKVPIPLVVRLAGTNGEEGRKRLTNNVNIEKSLEDAVKKAIKLVEENK